MVRRRACAAALVLAVAAAKLKGPHAGGVAAHYAERADRANHGESYCHPSRAGLRCQGLGPDKRCWIKESCKPDPTVQTLTISLTRTVPNDEHSAAESATCYGRRYPDLTYQFCEDGCDVRMLHKHFRDHGRAEGITSATAKTISVI